MITIFTPTFNRSYCLRNLYESLIKQSNQNFEWIIIDDGSTDDTKILVQKFIEDRKILIQYFKQSNKGKHIAINKGLELARGELFFIVDSDDTLLFNAVERIFYWYTFIKDDKLYAGICGNRCNENYQRIGENVNYTTLTTNSLDFRIKYKIKGDMAEVFRTDILRQYPFPEIENEKFCTEALVFNRIAQSFNLLYFNENIYVCEYLSDGLSNNIEKIHKASPIGTMIYQSEFSSYKIPVTFKIKSYIKFWYYSFFSSLNFCKKYKLLINKEGLLLLPIGYLYYLYKS